MLEWNNQAKKSRKETIEVETLELCRVTCPTAFDISPALLGKMRVLLVRANFSKAFTYCSATTKDAAFLPFCKEKNEIGFHD